MEAIDKCLNCGAGWGLHRYETLQCPKNGVEARMDVKQEWESTVFRALENINLKQQRDELSLRANQLLSSLEYERLTKFQKSVVVLLEQAIKNCK